MAPLRGVPLRSLAATCVAPRDNMLDILLLGLGVGAFLLLAAYAAGCERV